MHDTLLLPEAGVFESWCSTVVKAIRQWFVVFSLLFVYVLVYVCVCMAQ